MIPNTVTELTIQTYISANVVELCLLRHGQFCNRNTWSHIYSSKTDKISGTVAQVLALPPHSKKVMGSIPAWGAVGSGGQVPGLSVWSLHVLPVFTRGFFH